MRNLSYLITAPISLFFIMGTLTFMMRKMDIASRGTEYQLADFGITKKIIKAEPITIPYFAINKISEIRNREGGLRDFTIQTKNKEKMTISGLNDMEGINNHIKYMCPKIKASTTISNYTFYSEVGRKKAVRNLIIYLIFSIMAFAIFAFFNKKYQFLPDNLAIPVFTFLMLILEELRKLFVKILNNKFNPGSNND